MGYGTGAIMAVPGHDERDYRFAKQFGLPVQEVVAGGDIAVAAYTGEGTAIHSANSEVSLNGRPTAEAVAVITQWLQTTGHGAPAVQFKLRDWLFSRQRYWGEPIPIVHFDDGTMEALPLSELPLLLPDLKKFQPSGTTESPLALATDWVSVRDTKTGRIGRRETNTMPQWAGSCWYYLRYLDPRNDSTFCSKEAERRWMPVDLYIGGAEHAVLHLMYSRFWHKILYDLGYVSTKEPFPKLRHQGTILGEDSRKMSKSRGNVVNPDDVVAQYGADSLRLFEMFMGPLEDVKPWSTRGVEGVHRFLSRVWRLFIRDDGTIDSAIQFIGVNDSLERLYHATVKKVGEDIDALRFNTAIAQMMIFVNEVMKTELRPRQFLEPFLLILAPFAPHLAEELWEHLGHKTSLAREPWPAYDPAKLVQVTVEVVLQVNGKVRGKMEVAAGLGEEDLEARARADEGIKKHMEGKKVVKAIVVKNRLVNLVVE
jgi:leucyl-tRNA synthetase